MYKQVIVVNKELCLSPGRLGSQVSHASIAFITKMIQSNTSKHIIEQWYPAWEDEAHTKPQFYKRSDLYHWSQDARKNGKDGFYAKPINPNEPYGKLTLCNPTYDYDCHVRIERDLYEQWINGIFTKVILEAENENQMQEIIDKAKEIGMIEDKDFFCIRDTCSTELEPDKTNTKWTCIGFAPMDTNKIDKITQKLPLYKD